MLHRIVPNTPEKALEAYQQAVTLQDWDKCWTLLSKDVQDIWNARAEDFTRSFRKLTDGPDRRTAEEELRRMGYAPSQARDVTGRMLMIGTCRRDFAVDPDSFLAFAGAARLGHQQMGRYALVDFRMTGHQQPMHIRTRRSGVLWYLTLPPPSVIPGLAGGAEPSPPPPASNP